MRAYSLPTYFALYCLLQAGSTVGIGIVYHTYTLHFSIAEDDILTMTVIVMRLDYVVIEIFGLLPA